MALRLRTRLFLIVAAVLGASILLSAVLSRRATLVEVRATAGELPDPAGTRTALDRALEVVAETPVADLPQALAAIEKETSRRLLVVDGSRAVVAASNRSLAGATIKTLSNDGTFSVGERGATAFPCDAFRSGHTSGTPCRDATRDVRARGRLAGDEEQR